MTLQDPCWNAKMNPYGFTRPLVSKISKGDRYLIPGPYADIDLATEDSGLGKCGEVRCAAHYDDHVSTPEFLILNNRVLRSVDNTFNTEVLLRPIPERDSIGHYDVFIDCEFIEYPDLNVFSQKISVDVIEWAPCKPGEGGTNDSSCSDSSEEVMSDDDLGNGVSADDSSNDGYSGNDMASSDSSGDGPSIGDNVTSDTTGDGDSGDDWGPRRLDDFTDVEHGVDLMSETQNERAR